MTRTALVRGLAGGSRLALLVFAMALVFSQVSQPSRIPPLWRPWAETGVLACGLTAILLTGGIDLSIGSTVSLCSAVLGVLMVGWHLPWVVAAVLTVACGGLAGALNGTLVVLGIGSLVATLATMALFAGLALAITRGERVTGLPADLTQLGQGDFMGLPNQLWLLLAVALAMSILVHATRSGRWLFAVGDNREAARFAAVPVARLEWSLYALSGLLAGLVALSQTARVGAAVPNLGQGLELQAVACVVLGGTRVTGGFGSIGRTILGLVVLAHLEIGLRLLGSRKWTPPGFSTSLMLNANLRLIVIGVLLVLVALVNERVAGAAVGRSRSTS